MLRVAELKALLRVHGLRLKKRLGQHQLVDPQVVERLVGRMELSKDDVVVEIGAGLGALTERLGHDAGRVIAVEVDSRHAELLAERLAARANIFVRCEDILRFDWSQVRDAVVVGAIPYRITSGILVRLFEVRHAFRAAWLILQKEVVRRLVARPGTKPYGRLSLLGQYGWEMRQEFEVSRRAFFPQPQVDSACVRLLRRAHPPVQLADEANFFALVKSAFAQRRKTLVNCLSRTGAGRMSRAEAEQAVRELGVPASVRGEALSLEQFARLANGLRRSQPLR